MRINTRPVNGERQTVMQVLAPFSRNWESLFPTPADGDFPDKRVPILMQSIRG
jgi:hypothetical protein